MTAAEVLKACVEHSKLPFLVIGGFAVIAHGYQRTTMDLDLLIRRTHADQWTDALKRIGYDLAYAHQTFARYRSSRGIDLDVMYVNDETFDGMFAASMPTQFQGVPVKVPSLEHLLALKLHVSKQELRHRRLYDWDDIVTLVVQNKVDLRESRWRAVFEKYGTLELYEKVRRATEP
jgi:hypothetical protein